MVVIKTREFWTRNLDKENIDDLINDFLEEEQNIELIDIKYQTLVYEGVGTPIVRTSALVIYKEEEEIK